MGLSVNCKIPSVLIIFLLSTALAVAAPITAASNATPAIPLTLQPFSIALFTPSPEMIHSDQILDQVNTPEGGVLFGTSFGLSEYNGTWSNRHINRNNISEGLMDEFVTAVEYDHEGNLWIGYSGGIQIYNGVSYVSLRDQQLFKDPRIHDLQRWHDDMWVATGHAGIHRYRQGTWTWFQPMTDNGPGFYEIRDMTLDPSSDSLVIATADNGLWRVPSPNDPVVFEQIAEQDGSFGLLQDVRRDPFGGVYFFNETTVIHYSPAKGFTPVLSVQDLSQARIHINDLTAAPYGSLFLGTDNGIFIWRDNAIYRHISRFEGIGSSEIVRSVAIDAENRVWFSTIDYVGYYREQSESQNPIPIQVITPEVLVISQTPAEITPDTPTISVTAANHTQEPESGQSGLAPILDPIVRAITTILAKFGVGPAPS
jgi:ligand-binding sensor domain-containing protein